jgi:transcriptional regulator with XRE-family HTH domain
MPNFATLLTKLATLHYSALVETKPISELLRDLRSSRGASLRSAAKDLGVAPSLLSRIERGERMATPEFQERAAHYYDVEPDVVQLAAGRIPDDIVEILRRNPGLIERLRREHGTSA